MCTDELDLLLREQIIPNIYEDEEDFNEIYKDKANNLNTPIKIDTLREHLNLLEKKGANFVSIMYHPDHIEYELDGQLVREATQEEINEHTLKQKEFQLTQIKKRIAELEEQTKQFKNKLNELTGN
jgi:vacuolar-type H+-ATPase subunit I/STV1